MSESAVLVTYIGISLFLLVIWVYVFDAHDRIKRIEKCLERKDKTK